MKLEEAIKSSVLLENPKKTILNIFFTQNILNDNLNEILKPHDLSAEQFNVLRILRGQKGKPANMCLIQERMLAKTSNTTRLVDKLLIKNFVTRAVCEVNRRKIEVQITSEGLEVLQQLDSKIIDYEYSFAKNLDKNELNQLNYLLEKYRNTDTNL